MKYLLSMLSSVFIATVCYANVNDLINETSQSAKEQQDTVSKETLARMSKESNQSYGQNQPLIDQIIQTTRQGLPQAQKGQYVDGAVLFVSFSMPEQLLFSLADEAAAYKIPVVINGLVDGDFKKTITEFSRLHDRAKKTQFTFKGVSIDPLWFEQFHITAVPALVVSKRPSTCGQQLLCKEQTFDVVYGNVSVKKGLELISNKGESASEVAKDILEKGYV